MVYVFTPNQVYEVDVNNVQPNQLNVSPNQLNGSFDSVKSGEWSVNSTPSDDSEYIHLCKRLSNALGNMAMSP